MRDQTEALREARDEAIAEYMDIFGVDRPDAARAVDGMALDLADRERVPVEYVNRAARRAAKKGKRNVAKFEG